MKKGIILLLILVVLLGGATLWYNSLSDDYAVSADVYMPSVTDNSADETAMEKAENIAPDITVLDTDGNEVKLSDHFGKPIVLNFWATWCGPCRSEFPAFENAFLEYGEDVTFIMVNLTDGKRDTVEGVRQFISDNGYSFPVYYDTSMEAAITYGAYAIPLSVFINSDAEIVASHNSAMNQETLYSYIEAIL